MSSDQLKTPRTHRAIILIAFFVAPISSLIVIFWLRPVNLLIGLLTLLIAFIFWSQLIVLLIEPYYGRDSDTYHAPTADQRRELERLCERTGLEVQDVGVSTGLKRLMPAVVVGSFPHNRHLVADETFFTDHSAREREAVVALETYRANHYYSAFTGVITTLPLIGYFVLIGQLRYHGMSPLGPWLFTLGAILSFLVFFLLARRLVYRAFDHAIEQTDVETVESVWKKSNDRVGTLRKGLTENRLEILIVPPLRKQRKYFSKME